MRVDAIIDRAATGKCIGNFAKGVLDGTFVTRQCGIARCFGSFEVVCGGTAIEDPLAQRSVSRFLETAVFEYLEQSGAGIAKQPGQRERGEEGSTRNADIGISSALGMFGSNHIGTA